MFDLSKYNTFNLTVYSQCGREIRSPADLKEPITKPYIILGGGSDVLFTEDFDGTVLINRIQGVEIKKCSGVLPELLQSLYKDKDPSFSQFKAELKTALSGTPDKNLEKHSELHQGLSVDSSLDSSKESALVEKNGLVEGDYYRVRVGGGVILDELIDELLDKGIPGLENLSLIPGTVGAAPIQNIGAYGVEIGDFIESVEAHHLETGESRVFLNAECNFGYRSSIFKESEYKSYFITHVNLVLPSTFMPRQNYAGLQSYEFKEPRALRDRVIALRNEKLPNPKYVGNAGSFFKNPYVPSERLSELKKEYENVPAYKQEDGSFKLAAGWLIDKANCRGIKHGQVGTWGNQALVIVNLGKAKPHEVVAIAKYVSTEVKSKFGIDLVPEVRLYGKHGEKEWAQI